MPQRLSSELFEKVWGSPLTQPWFANPDHRKIGEIWFRASEAVPILAKLLFTSENLSIQVHPDDAYARVHEEGSPGKTEMWHILRAEPGAKIAVGLREEISREQLAAAAQSGEILDMLRWVEVSPGDTYFIPAGTIHAIGGGMALCEIQQPSDVTYRLFDYGRPRELHLDRSLDVSDLSPRETHVPRQPLGEGRELLAQCAYFRTERLSVRGSSVLPALAKSYLCIVLAGTGLLSDSPFSPGDAWEIEAIAHPVPIESPDATLLITSIP